MGREINARSQTIASIILFIELTAHMHILWCMWSILSLLVYNVHSNCYSEVLFFRNKMGLELITNGALLLYCNFHSCSFH